MRPRDSLSDSITKVSVLKENEETCEFFQQSLHKILSLRFDSARLRRWLRSKRFEAECQDKLGQIRKSGR